jgi:uncharacterized protein (TIGR02246 family)
MPKLLLASVVGVIGLSNAPIAQAERSDALAQASLDWARSWQAKQLEPVLSLYTEDAVFMDSNGSRVAGKSALRKFFATVLEQYSAHPSLRSVNNGSSGDLGYDWGDYTETVVPVAKPTNAIQTSGTYLVILRKVSSRWLIASQMWTGSVPVPVKK